MTIQLPRKTWNNRYNKNSKTNVIPLDDLWIKRWEPLLKKISNRKALDLGCGSGNDTQSLCQLDFEVTAVDFSKEALEVCRKKTPEAIFIEHDISQILPFDDSSFGLILANLSLHYFETGTTRLIIKEIQRCVEKDGIVMICLNSTKDFNFGAKGETEIEPNYYFCHGLPKRFFDREAIDHFFDTSWSRVNLEELTTNKYGSPKQLWELILKK